MWFAVFTSIASMNLPLGWLLPSFGKAVRMIRSNLDGISYNPKRGQLLFSLADQSIFGIFFHSG
jgi:hypothetical protein